tara:strand:- start:2086 stop:2298 length:213 start_codon:yes stop_codon:yes gene_type:complete
MGTKKGQVRKTARRAYEGKGPRKPRKFYFFAISRDPPPRLSGIFGWIDTPNKNMGKTPVHIDLKKSRRLK